MEHESITFLVVDEQTQIRRTYKNNLLSMGVNRVIESSDGKDALSKLRKEQVDYIVSAWDLPKLDGLELLKEVRTNPKFKKIPFMLVSGETSREQVELAIKSGIDGFLIKPFTPSQLIQKIKKLTAAKKHASITQKEEIKEKEEKQSNNSKKRILVVDDTPTNIDVIRGILSSEYQVLAAKDGKSALKISSSNSTPDLILLDIMMPEMDGMEVCEELKSDPLTEHIPIIFLTAKSEANDVVAGLELGAVDYITKPVNPKILHARVKTHLSLKSSRDNLNHQIEDLIENSRLRDEIERMTQHDLKTPLLSIIETTEKLNSNKLIGTEQKKDISGISNIAYEALDLIGRSIDLYKIEDGSYKIKNEQIEITLLINKVINNIRAKNSETSKNIIFNAPENYITDGDSSLLYSMFNNMISSMIAVTPENNKINVSVTFKDKISINIHTSHYINQQSQSHFFDKFSDSDKECESKVKSYFSKLIAKYHGGDILLNCSENSGSTISIVLPASANQKLAS